MQAALVTLLMLIAADLVGCFLLRHAGLTGHLRRGGIAWLTGYAALGLLLLLSLRLFENVLPGGLAFLLLCVAALHRRPEREAERAPREATLSRLIQLLILATWVIMIGLAYLPMAWRFGVEFRLVDVYDLPKHLLALRSLADAAQWPPANPFVPGESFAYNFLFYYPAALVAMMARDPNAIFVSFPLIVVATGLAVPMAVLDICGKLGIPRGANAIALLLVTWAGGLTPLLVQHQPPIGYFLFMEGFVPESVWADETFISLIFAPQHMFAAICALALPCIVLSQESRRLAARVALAGGITVAAALSSLILLPVVCLTFALVCLLAAARTAVQDQASTNRLRQPLLILLVGVVSASPLLPFVWEAMGWLGGGDGALFQLPSAHTGWLAIAAAFGLSLPLAFAGLSYAIADFSDRNGGRTAFVTESTPWLIVACIGLMLIGLIFIAFARYPDAAIKSTLFLRIAVVPLAVLGLVRLHDAIRPANRTMVATTFGTVCGVLSMMNFTSPVYYVKSAWRTQDTEIASLVDFLRNQPRTTRIAALGHDQILAALTNRPLAFDFRPHRKDMYVPAARATRVAEQWDRLAAGDAAAWKAFVGSNDLLVVPTAMLAERGELKKLKPVRRGNLYTVFAVRP
jgi:hypothetical protein